MQVDGVMMGREAYSNPYIMSQVDSELYGSAIDTLTRDEVLEQYIEYVDRNIESGVRLNHMSKHIVGLYHGEPRSRLFRRHISENAHKPGKGSEVLRLAYESMVDLVFSDNQALKS
jgi:tRNA-dihydrouridine synthase A